MSGAEALPSSVLPAGVRSRFVEGVNGLRMHVLEAGNPSHPLVLLLHGFPELAYSWRKIIAPLADAGYHIIAPDMRGYGRTTGWNANYDADVEPFRFLSVAADVLALVSAVGRRSVAAVVGHDFGSPVAAWCALARPDVFRSVALMSAPFAGPAPLPFDTDHHPQPAVKPADLFRDLAELARPRKHYIQYNATREANGDMLNCPQGVRAFLRAYYHMKSADWSGNDPHPLKERTAEELAKLPTYYIMDLAESMPATVAPFMPERPDCGWLTDNELSLYAGEYTRTAFQGGLNYYRAALAPANRSEFLFAGRTIDVPSLFISGKQDWGTYQSPGALEAMQGRSCTRLQGAHLVDGAGHWVQQEQPVTVTRLLLEFLTGQRQN